MSSAESAHIKKLFYKITFKMMTNHLINEIDIESYEIYPPRSHNGHLYKSSLLSQ